MYTAQIRLYLFFVVNISEYGRSILKKLTLIFFCKYIEKIKFIKDKIFFSQPFKNCHFSDENPHIIASKFPGCIISRKAKVDFPPRSLDMSL